MNTTIREVVPLPRVCRTRGCDEEASATGSMCPRCGEEFRALQLMEIRKRRLGLHPKPLTWREFAWDFGGMVALTVAWVALLLWVLP